MYLIKEIFHSLQGEGAMAGRASIFVRFAGCNLWDGLEEHRSSAPCQFCDTDFRGTDGTHGGRYESDQLASLCADLWGLKRTRRWAILTGGEPTLQIDSELIQALHRRGFGVAVETNGSRPVLPPVEWITVSPKAGVELVQACGDELKLVFPQVGVDPERFESLDFRHFFLQPMDGPQVASNTGLAVQYCLRNPRWRLSLQAHKILGIR